MRQNKIRRVQPKAEGSEGSYSNMECQTEVLNTNQAAVGFGLGCISPGIPGKAARGDPGPFISVLGAADWEIRSQVPCT